MRHGNLLSYLKDGVGTATVLADHVDIAAQVRIEPESLNSSFMMISLTYYVIMK